MDAITRSIRKTSPARQRRRVKCCGAIAALTGVVCVLAVFIGIMSYNQLFSDESGLEGREYRVAYAHKLAAGVMQGLSINILNTIYEAVADYLNYLENHKFDSQFDSSLAVKIFAFQFWPVLLHPLVDECQRQGQVDRPDPRQVPGRSGICHSSSMSPSPASSAPAGTATRASSTPSSSRRTSATPPSRSSQS